MVFSSLSFLCLFLPLTLGLYYLCPRKGRNTVLLLASLVFYAWGEPKYVVLMLLSIVVNYVFGLLLGRNKSKLWLILSVVFNIGILGIFKYADLLIRTTNALLRSDLKLLELALPIGISFYTFQAMSYTIDVYRGKVSVQRNLLDFGAYIAMFPQLIAGPIVRYSDIEERLKDRRVTAEDFAAGLMRFSVGLAKKVFLANQLGKLWTMASGLSRPSALMSWMGAVAFMFQIYFDFSGYSDMAIGLGELFGFRFPENFRYPYSAVSITDFWRRWHISLSTWFREYLYIPLGGNKKGLLRQVVNLLIVWGLTGLWHGAEWNFLLWGLYYSLLLVLEKLFLLRRLERIPAVFGRIYTLIAVLFGWVLFACAPGSLIGYVSAMFGKNGAVSSMDVYYLLKYAVLSVVAVIGCTELPRRISEKIPSFWPKAIGSTVLIVISMMLLIGDTYNPFLYFRF